MKKLVMVLCVLALVACNKKEEEDDTIVVSDLAAYVGTWRKCEIIGQTRGTEFNATSSMSVEIRIAADGTYTHYRWFHSGVDNCLGGENAISYYQAGTVDVTGDSSSVSGGKEIMFTSSTSQVTVRNGATSQFYEEFSADYAHNFVLTGGGGAMGSGSKNDPTGTRIGNQGNEIQFFDAFPGAVNVSYNVFSLSGNTLTISEPWDWDAGVGAYPISVNWAMTKQ